MKPVAEKHLVRWVLKTYGAHPRLRIARVNTGVGWFNGEGQPCRKTDLGAHPVRFNPIGTSDIIGIMSPNGRFISIECKRLGGKMTTEQKIMKRVIEKFGGLHIFAEKESDVTTAFENEGIHL